MKKQRVLRESESKIIQIRDRNRKRKKNRRIAFGVILLLIGVMLALLLLPCFEIKYIDTVGNEKVTHALLTEKSTVVYGENIFKVNIKKGKKQILQIPYVETVKIKRQLPNIVFIEIEERKPIGALPAGEGFALIDKECRILETVPERTVPLIEGLDVKIVEGEYLNNQVSEFVANFKKLTQLLSNKTIKDRITNYIVDKNGNITFVIDGGKSVILGEEKNIEYKLLLLEAAVNELPPTQRGTIDLSEEGKALFSPEE